MSFLIKRFHANITLCRLANREDSFAKRRGALDSLVAGGMFGKAAKRGDYEYDV